VVQARDGHLDVVDLVEVEPEPCLVGRADGAQTVEGAVGVGLAGLRVADQHDVAVTGVELRDPLEESIDEVLLVVVHEGSPLGLPPAARTGAGEVADAPGWCRVGDLWSPWQLRDFEEVRVHIVALFGSLLLLLRSFAPVQPPM